jgi:RNA polymerase sigma-70 factor (ECF subfamily)
VKDVTSAAIPAWLGNLALTHLDAAYNLGRWLLGNEHDAADAVHDAFLRAARGAGGYAGGDARAWWLAIVRNACKDKLARRKRERAHASFEQLAPAEAERLPHTGRTELEDAAASAQSAERVVAQLQKLPPEFREVLVLREIEDCSYREIADILAIPIGTVMSRLARGRALLKQALNPESSES